MARLVRTTRALSSAGARFMSTQEKYASIDVHTHMYLPRYMDMLRNRVNVPRVVNFGEGDRLIILPGEDEEMSTASGRPIGDEYFDIQTKLAFMDQHQIDASVISLANPWLDFLSGTECTDMATALNEDMEALCQSPFTNDGSGKQRLWGLGTLPTGAGADACCAELQRLSTLPSVRGIILGCHGLGKGLDAPEMLPVLKTAAEAGVTIFLHPHYGVGNEHFGGAGHSLFLALGFTFETTTAVSRLICSGFLDEVPDLRLLLAHSGGTLPFLAGRLESCIQGDEHVADRLKHSAVDYLKRFYYDALVYHEPAVQCLLDFVGPDQVMFGTDNPFFPPPAGDDGVTMWPSVGKNYTALQGQTADVKRAILSGNAVRLLGLK